MGAARARRLRALALGLLLTLGALALLLGGGLLFLQSGAGRALVRAQLLAVVEGALQGKVEVGALELDASGHLVVTGLRLFTPEGALVAEVRRLEADVALPALAGSVVKLTRVRIEAPRLLLVRDARGLNLARALAAKAPPAPPAPSAPNPWRVELDALELVEGALDYADDERRVTAGALTATGAAQLALSPLAASAALELRARLTAPLEEELVLLASTRAEPTPQRAHLAVTLGQTRLRGEVALPSLEVTLDEVVAAPRELQAFLPAWPLRVPVTVKGSASPTRAALDVRAGGATASLRAQYALEPLALPSLSLTAKDVDLAELVGAERPSRLALEASAAFTDARPEHLTGTARLDGTWASLGQPLAAVGLDLAAEGGAVTVQRLQATTPGASLSVKGAASREALALDGTLTAESLARLAATLRSYAGVDAAGLSGSGALTVHVAGAPLHPSLRAVGHLQRLAVGGVSAERVDVAADVPDVTRPVDTDVRLRARRVTLGERTFEEVTLALDTHGRELDLDLSTRGLGDVKVHAAGRLDRDSRGVSLSALELSSAEARWALEAPVRVVWPEGLLRVEPLRLRDGAQAVALVFEQRGSRLSGSVEVRELDLARLPRVVAPEAWGLRGRLSLAAQVAGRSARPTVKARVELRDASLLDITGLRLTAEGAWEDERAKGTLDLASSVGAASGTFDVPVRAWLDEAGDTGTLRLEVRDVDTRAVERHLGRPLPVRGVLGAQLEASGSGRAPVVRLTLEAPSLEVPVDDAAGTFVAVDRPRLLVTTRDDGTLEAQVTATALGGLAEVRLGTPLTLASLRRQALTAAALRALPVTLSVELQGLLLRALHDTRLVADDELAGTVGLSAAFQGPLDAPRGQATLTLARATVPPLRALDATLTLKATDAGTRVEGAASLAGKPVLTLLGGLAAPLEQLLAPDALGAAALDAALTVLPTRLEEVLPHAEGQRTTSGSLRALLSLGGTLDAPTASLQGSLAELRFDRVALGSARFDLRSEGTQQTWALALGGQGRDDFKVKGTTGLDVRWAALRRGLSWREAPVALTLEARRFDVAFLSGASDLLRAVAGRLDLSGRVSGTLGAPAFVGDAAFHEGRLALAGFGDYRDVELALHATNDRVELRTLQLRSGAGQATLTATAVRQPSGSFRLTSEGAMERFPLVNDDQLVATTSLKLALAGDVTATGVTIQSLDLPRVDVDLPDVKRKDLQDLVRPGDIILLRGGARTTARRRQAAKSEAAAQATPAAFAVRAVLNAPRNIWVRSSDLNVELGLSEGFRLERTDATRLFGEVAILKGTLSVIGREFAIQKGSQARFAGPAGEPYVNVTALHVNERAKVKVTVSVVGKGTDVAIKPTSEPPLPESDIYTLLATGRLELKSGTGATITGDQAASVIGQYATSLARAKLAKHLPIDVLNFEMLDNFQSFKFDAGKYLSDSLYLGITGQVGANRARGENQAAARLEYQVTRDWSLEATAGDVSVAADVVWSRDF